MRRLVNRYLIVVDKAIPDPHPRYQVQVDHAEDLVFHSNINVLRAIRHNFGGEVFVKRLLA